MHFVGWHVLTEVRMMVMPKALAALGHANTPCCFVGNIQ
jgi:hypothetical protein